jgi:hypothetical protein
MSKKRWPDLTNRSYHRLAENRERLQKRITGNLVEKPSGHVFYTAWSRLLALLIRTDAAYPRKFRYVPPRWETVSDGAFPLIELLKAEPEPFGRSAV